MPNPLLRASRPGRPADRLTGALERSTEPVFLVGTDGTPLWWNPAADPFLTRDGAIADLATALVDGAEIVARIAAVTGAGGDWHGELTFADADGRHRRLAARAVPDLDGRGRATGFIVLANDRTPADTGALSGRDLLHDELTGLATVALLEDRLTSATDRSILSGTHAALLIVDLDRFSVVNESLGADAGDRMLRMVAERLVDGARRGETVARTGGDEFAVLVEGLGGPADARRAAEAVLEGLSAPFDLGTGTVLVSASVGIVGLDPALSTEEQLRRADVALVRAKNKGGSRYAVYDEPGAHSMDRRQRVEAALHDRLARGDIELAFEPVVDLRSGWITAANATLAPDWPEIGPVNLEEIREVANRSRLTEALESCIAVSAARAALRWPDEISVGFEVTASTLADGRLPVLLAAVHDGVGLGPDRLLVGVTEDALQGEPTAVATSLKDARRLGARTVLRDAGVGTIALGPLRWSPFDEVELHRELLDDLDSDGTRAVVGAVLGVAEVLGMTVGASGVDDDDQLDAARSLGCAQARGARVGEPVPADALDAWFSAARAGRRPPEGADAG